MNFWNFKQPTLELAQSFGITVESHGNYTAKLVPVGPWVLQTELVQKMVDWREAYRESFLSQFAPSVSGMVRYLQEKAIADPGSLLFAIMVDSSFVGHIGLSRFNGTTARLDNVMKGERGLHPDLMSHVLSALFFWCNHTMEIRTIELDVLIENAKAKKLYEKNGFVVTNEVVLKRVEFNGEIKLMPALPSEKIITSLLEMRKILG